MARQSCESEDEILTVGVVGFYGMSNFGDDLFSAVIAQTRPRLDPGARLLFCCPPVSDVGAEFTVNSALASAWYSDTGLIGSTVRVLSGLSCFAKADTIMLGGGSVLSTVHGVRRLQAQLERVRSHEWLALGVSVGPFQTVRDEDRVRNFLGKFSFVSVRDQSSLERLTSYELDTQVALSGDLAALMSVEHPKKLSNSDAGGILLGYIPCREVPVSVQRGIVGEMSHALGQVGSGARVAVYSLNNHPRYGDDVLADEAVRQFRAAGVSTDLVRYSDHGLRNTWEMIGLSDLVVSGRLHGAFAAYLQSVPVALVNYHEKCAQMARDIALPDAMLINRASDVAGLVEGVRGLSHWAMPGHSADWYRTRARKALLDGLA